MASSKDFSVAKKIDDLLEDAKELSDIKRENKLIASKLSIELNMQKTIEVINKV